MFSPVAIASVLHHYAKGTLDDIDSPYRPALGTGYCVQAPEGLRPLTLLEYATDELVVEAFKALLAQERRLAIALILVYFQGATVQEMAAAFNLRDVYAGWDLLIQAQQSFAKMLYEV